MPDQFRKRLYVVNTGNDLPWDRSLYAICPNDKLQSDALVWTRQDGIDNGLIVESPGDAFHLKPVAAFIHRLRNIDGKEEGDVDVIVGSLLS